MEKNVFHAVLHCTTFFFTSMARFKSGRDNTAYVKFLDII